MVYQSWHKPAFFDMLQLQRGWILKVEKIQHCGETHREDTRDI